MLHVHRSRSVSVGAFRQVVHSASKFECYIVCIISMQGVPFKFPQPMNDILVLFLFTFSLWHMYIKHSGHKFSTNSHANGAWKLWDEEVDAKKRGEPVDEKCAGDRVAALYVLEDELFCILVLNSRSIQISCRVAKTLMRFFHILICKSGKWPRPSYFFMETFDFVGKIQERARSHQIGKLSPLKMINVMALVAASSQI